MEKPAKKAAVNQSPDGTNSKEAILSAALKAFARDGYDGASMPKIARMAGVAAPLIHYYFGSKEKLWRETVDYSLGELRRESSAIHKATRSLAPLDRLRALLQAHTHFAAHWPDHFAMIVAEARADSDRFAWIQENYTGILFGEVVTILEDARKCGAIKDINVEQAAFMLIGSILLYFTVRPEPFEVGGLEKISGEFTDLVFNTFLHGAAARTVS